MGVTKKYDVFINYNFKDVLAVDVLEARLKAHGIRCWRDEWEMLAGDDIVTSLREGIEESSIVIVFVGRNSLGPWQKREIVSAQVEQRIQKNKQLIPVFFPGPSKEEREKLADFLKTPLGVVFGHLDEKAPFEKLLKSIQGKLLAQEPGREFLACDDSALPRRELQNPYKGLSKFLEGDEETFFGREQATEVLMEKMERALSTPEKARLFVLTGASGCGKSSLARAGLMAGLKRKWGDTWCYATVDHPGNNPLNELATKLSGETRLPFEAELHADFRALDSKMSQCILDGSDGKFVLLVDQFEEVFTLCENADKGRSFMANLLFAASKDNGKGIVLLTLRSEFWQSFMDAVEAEKKACNGKASLFKESSIQPVAPMDREELRRAIEAPAQQMGVGYEAALLEKLLEDAGAVRKDANAREGILPLLQVALEELWQFRSPHHISYGAYQETGGIRGALEKRANDIYGGFNEAQRRMAQHIFLNLLRINPDAPETRQRVGVDEFSVKGHTKEEVAQVVQKLVDGRLLVSDKGEVEIIHETLIHHWSVLRDWVEKNREGKKRKQGIEDGAALWKSGTGDLLTGNTLAAALAWEEEDAASAVPLGLNTKAREFLKASRKRQEEERIKENTRLRRQRIVYAVSATVMAVLLVIVGFMWKESERLRANAEQQRAVADARRLASSSLLEQNRPALLFEVFEKDKRFSLSLLLAMASIQEMEAMQSPALAESERALLSTPPLHAQLSLGQLRYMAPLVFSPDGSLLVSASEDKTLILWDVKQQQALATLPGHDAKVKHLSFSPDGSVLVSASEDKTLIFWDVKQQKALATLSGHSHLASSPDGSLLVSKNDEGVTLWDVNQQKNLAAFHGNVRALRHLALSPDGNLLALAACSQLILLDAKHQEVLWNLRGDECIHHVSFSPDGKVLASSSFGPTDERKLTAADFPIFKTTLWDAKQQQVLTVLHGHGSLIDHLSFSPDGSLLATADSSATITLWDVNKQQRLTLFRGKHLSFSPDGSLLASATYDGTIQLWDVKQRQALVTLGQQKVSHLSFSPDGNLLASANNETIILWDTSRASWRERARRIANRNMTLEEWRTHMGERTYRKIFEDLPGPLDAP